MRMVDMDGSMAMIEHYNVRVRQRMDTDFPRERRVLNVLLISYVELTDYFKFQNYPEKFVD